ncbi:MAG: hypothetical protein V1754_14215, partial [Pseudomonadota bacterium]
KQIETRKSIDSCTHNNMASTNKRYQIVFNGSARSSLVMLRVRTAASNAAEPNEPNQNNLV